MFKVIVLTNLFTTPFFFSVVSSMWAVSSLLNHPAYVQQPFSLPESLKNWFSLGNSASATKSVAHNWHSDTTRHNSPAYHLILDPLNSLHCTESRLFFPLSCSSALWPSLRAAQLFCLSWLHHFSVPQHTALLHTPAEIKAGKSWCDALIQHMQLISACFLNQKIQDIFCYTKREYSKRTDYKADS